MNRPANLQNGEMDCTLTKLRRKHRKLMARLHAAYATGNKTRIRKATRDCLRSSAFRTVGVIEANKKLPTKRRATMETCLGTGPQIKWAKPTSEPVRIRSVEKKGGGIRAICSFGLRHRGAQLALRWVLTPALVPQPWQFEFKPGGISSAIKAVKQQVQDGQAWATRLDVKAFFPSFTEEGLMQLLPLSRAVIRNHVLAKRLNFALPSGSGTAGSTKPTSNGTDGNNPLPPGAGTHQDLQALIHIGHQGVPQGSALSPLVAALEMSRLGPVPGVVNWVDDFAVLGASKDEVEQRSKALVAAVAALPGGHFQLLVKRGTRPLAEGLTFLAHHLTSPGTKVEIDPAVGDEFYRRLNDMDTSFTACLAKGNKEEAFRCLGRMWVYARSWCGVFEACDDISDYTDAIKCRIEQDLPVTGKTWASVVAFRDPGAQFKLESFS